MTENSTAIAIAQPVTVEEMLSHHAALRTLKDKLLEKGVDYGTIPGCGDKPAIFKPGAEKVMMFFRVHTTGCVIEDLSTATVVHYRVTLTGTTPDHVVRGIGVGECSSAEEKYAWRKAVCKEEYDAATIKRIKYGFQRGGGHYETPQIGTNPADQRNTVLKMAKKRASVDLALTSCAASQFFTQDVGDMTPEARDAFDKSQGRRRSDLADSIYNAAGAPIETTAEDVPPADVSPREAVWRAGKEMDASTEQIKAAVMKAQESDDVPENSAEWTTDHADKILAYISEAVA